MASPVFSRHCPALRGLKVWKRLYTHVLQGAANSPEIPETEGVPVVERNRDLRSMLAGLLSRKSPEERVWQRCQALVQARFVAEAESISDHA